MNILISLSRAWARSQKPSFQARYSPSLLRGASVVIIIIQAAAEWLKGRSNHDGSGGQHYRHSFPSQSSARLNDRFFFARIILITEWRHNLEDCKRSATAGKWKRQMQTNTDFKSWNISQNGANTRKISKLEIFKQWFQIGSPFSEIESTTQEQNPGFQDWLQKTDRRIFWLVSVDLVVRASASGVGGPNWIPALTFHFLSPM